MADQKRGDDAAKHVPKSGSTKIGDQTAGAPKTKPQDAPNTEDRIDGGRAESIEKLNSANDA